jgi:acylphosphatase
MSAMNRLRLTLALLLLGLAALPAPAADTNVARMVHYTGEVQGVGFRATTADIARDYRVTGWVKNLADGRVRLLVEGPEDEVRKFLDAVRTRWKRNITKEQTEERPVSGKYTKFEVAPSRP